MKRTKYPEPMSGTWSEHYELEDYPDDALNTMEAFYTTNPKLYTEKKIMDVDGKILNDKQKEHLIVHMRAIQNLELIKDLGTGHIKEIRQSALTNPPNAVRVIVRHRRGKPHIYYRDFVTGRFVGSKPKEKEKKE